MAEPKLNNPPDVVQDAPLTPSSDEADGASASASPVSSPTAGKSDNYFSRKFGSILNRSKRKLKKNGSQDTVDIEHQNGHDSGEKSPTQKSPKKSPKTPQKSPRTPNTPENRQSKFQKLFRSSKRSKSADMVEDEAASTSQIGTSETPESAKEKHANSTKYGQQRQIVVDGKALKEIEVTGEKQQECIPETRRHRRISKSRRKAEFEGDELKVQCRDLAPADYEGWLYKKSGGTGLSPVVWKQCWVVLKNGILYLFKTSFDIAAQHAYSVRNFSVAPIEEKRKFTFKLFPKNVPPEALQDAKGVVFSSESNGDVEKWCDVLNKAALGFIIQTSTPAEQAEPVRRRCQTSAVKRNKNNPLSVGSNQSGLRIRSSTFTGETTGLPSTFNRTTSTSRVRKVSQSGSSSVLAVGTMFRVIDEPEVKGENSNGDLSSILYKDNQLSDDVKTTMTGQRSPMSGPTEEEVRMQVKKEVERINKQAKPVKPVEGATVASTKKADIIRQEIQNLKEKESQRLIDDDAARNDDDITMEDAAGEEDDGTQVEDAAREEDGDTKTEDATTKEDHAIQVEDFSNKKEDISMAEEEAMKDGLSDTKEEEEAPSMDQAADDAESDSEFQVSETHEADGAATFTEVETDIDAAAEEEVATKKSTVSKLEDGDAHVVFGVSQVSDGTAGITVEEYLQQIEASGNETTVEEYLALHSKEDVAAEEQEEQKEETTVEEYLALNAKEEDGAEEKEEQKEDTTVEEYLALNARDIVEEEEEQEEEEDEITVEEYLKKAEQSEGGTSVEDYLKGFQASAEAPIPAKDSNTNLTKEEGDDKSYEEPKRESVTHGSMIPAKQQRMLIDAVASLDYPSDTDSESADSRNGDEICHYAKIERPSTPEAKLDSGDNESENADSDLDIVLGAPPEFQDEKHHSLSRVRDHNVQYGATEEEKFVVHHTYMREPAPGESDVAGDKSSTVDQREGERPADAEDPFTVYCEDNADIATEHVLPTTTEEELAKFEERLNKLIEEEDRMLSEMDRDTERAGDATTEAPGHVEIVTTHEVLGGQSPNESQDGSVKSVDKEKEKIDEEIELPKRDEEEQEKILLDAANEEASVKISNMAEIQEFEIQAEEAPKKDSTALIHGMQQIDTDIDNNNIGPSEKRDSEQPSSPTSKTIKIIKVAVNVNDSPDEALEVRLDSAV